MLIIKYTKFVNLNEMLVIIFVDFRVSEFLFGNLLCLLSDVLESVSAASSFFKSENYSGVFYVSVLCPETAFRRLLEKLSIIMLIAVNNL